jgi:N-acetylmuramoyl-L-alanine amidase
MPRHLTYKWLLFRPWPSFANPLKIVTVLLPTVLILEVLASPLNPAHGQQPVPTPIPSTPADTNVSAQAARSLLRLGSQGDAVKELQALLTLLGFYTGAVDGIYQASTVAGVTAFQTAAGLQPDGVVGPATWSRLLPPAQSANPLNVSPVSAVPPAAIRTSTSAAAIGSTPSTSAVRSPSPSAQPTPPRREESATPRPTPSTAPEPTALVDLPVLRLGMQGPAVTRLQQRLQALGFLEGAADGVFGPGTQAAVRAAQRHFRLNPDGVVGPATWTGLMQ